MTKEEEEDACCSPPAPSPPRVHHAGGCVFGFWYVLGVLEATAARRNPHDVLQCVSGSALAAAIHLCDGDAATQIRVCASLRPHLLAAPRRAFVILREWLHAALPEDCARRCRGRLRVLLRRVDGLCGGLPCCATERWESKHELIECLLAACSPVPRRLADGRLYMDCGGGYYHCLRRPPSNVDFLPCRLVWRVPTADGACALLDAGRRDGACAAAR